MRIGKFSLDYCFLRSESYDTINSIFKFLEFIPIKTESRPDKDRTEYTGISYRFEDVPTPFYGIAIDENKVISIKKIGM